MKTAVSGNPRRRMLELVGAVYATDWSSNRDWVNPAAVATIQHLRIPFIRSPACDVIAANTITIAEQQPAVGCDGTQWRH